MAGFSALSSDSSNNKNDNSNHAVVAQGLVETAQKVEASLLTAIEEYVTSQDFSRQQHGLDFLDTKNSLLLSYLIDLTVYLRNRLTRDDDDDDVPKKNLARLLEMRTALDKMRNLDKKLRYQIDKLLASASVATNATAFVTSDRTAAEDPLQFRPRVDSLEEDDNKSDEKKDSEGSDNGDDSNDEMDDNLAAARQTLRMAGAGAKKKQDNDEEEDEGGAAVYRAPRLSAVPYTHDKESAQTEREKRDRRRMRASELANTLRSQFGDAPEQEDVHGGSELGKQREAARRMAEREAAKTKFEEESMVRLTTTRKEKKERARLMRMESSNLAALADMRNIVRDAAFGGDDDEEEEDRHATATRKKDSSSSGGRHSNGRRQRQAIDSDGKSVEQAKGKKRLQAKNSFQTALFSGESNGKPKKKKR